MNLQQREQAILQTLADLPRDELVLIGGYAVNVYVPPRFSVDCDLVVLGDVEALVPILEGAGFVRAAQGHVPYGSYVRFVDPTRGASFDLLVDSVLDRQTGIRFGRELFQRHAGLRTTIGRASPTRIELRVADPELLFAMKFVVGRRQDIRDLFMLAGAELSWEVIDGILRRQCPVELIERRAREIRTSVGAPTYRASLEGAFGKIPDERFATCRERLLTGVRGTPGSH